MRFKTIVARNIATDKFDYLLMLKNVESYEKNRLLSQIIVYTSHLLNTNILQFHANNKGQSFRRNITALYMYNARCSNQS